MIFSIILYCLTVAKLGLTQYNFQASLTCDQLPKVDVPCNEVLIANSPLTYDFALNAFYDCATEVITGPARGTRGYNGSAIIIKGSYVTVYDYKVSKDKKSAYSTRCYTGKTMNWYFSAAYFDDQGGFYCAYTCEGPALKEFGCVSNNYEHLPEEKAAVDLARRVPNGYRIRQSPTNCPTNGCYAFS